MAIHNDCPGLTVQIICGGKPIEEHVYEEDEEREEPKTTTRYIECQSNMEFAIKTTFRPPFAPLDLIMYVHLDGVKVDGLIARKHWMLDKTYVQSATKWKEGQKWRASKFVFSDLIMVQEESETLARENLSTLSHVGTISVVIFPILSTQKMSKPECKKKELREVGPISEEAFKGDARSHAIGLAPTLAIKVPNRYSTKKAKEPLVTFRFKYRSIAALKSLGIFPRSPSPSQDAQPESIREDSTLRLLPDLCVGDTSSVITPQAETASVTPVLLQQNSSLKNQRGPSSLTKKDILILIKHYRGSSDGLEGLSEKDLAILLSSYRGDKPDDTPIKQEPVFSRRRVGIKRESVGDSVARGQGKKRKMEIIVLDD